MAQILAVAWFRADQWNRLLSVSSDRSQLEDTYEEWRVNAEAQIATLRTQGYEVRKVDIDLDELESWCKSKKIAIDGESRSQFAAYKSQVDSRRN